MSEIGQKSVLNQKIGELIRRYKDLRLENERLRNELMEAKAQNETINLTLKELEDGVMEANLSENELLKQIESVLEE